MSVGVNTYIIFGITLDYKSCGDKYDELEPYMDETRGAVQSFTEVTCLYDGMNGEYVVCGYVLKRTDDYGQFDGVVELPEIGAEQLRTMEEGLEKALPHDTPYQRSRWLVVSHYR